MVLNRVKWKRLKFLRFGIEGFGLCPTTVSTQATTLCAMVAPTPTHVPEAPSVPTSASSRSETALSSTMDISNTTLQAQVARLQHQVSMLQCSEGEHVCSWRHRGRCFRRLVSMSDNIADILDEADRWGVLGGGDHTHDEQ